MIELIDGCRMSKPKVHPLNWKRASASTKKCWYIHYRFYDPEYYDDPKLRYGYLRVLKGMNHEKNLERRRYITEEFIKDEIALLKTGYNPITGRYYNPVGHIFELSPSTPFIKALWIAVEKVNAVPAYRIDMKSVIRGIEKAAGILSFDDLPVSRITRKYINIILEKCATLNPRWSARRHNVYRTALIALFKQLIQMEAVDINPVKDILKKVETKRERLTLTWDERKLINETLQRKQYNFWRLIQVFFHSGSRETELLSVKGKDVNLEDQTCKYTIRKGSSIREIRRPIKDIILPLWKELMLTCGDEDYLFSAGLVPGSSPIRPEQITRRWRRHVKHKLNIKSDLYALKHLQTTEMMDELTSESEVAKLTGHKSEALIISIYDKRNKQRKDDKIKKVWNAF